MSQADALDPRLEAFIDARIRSGRYTDPEQVIHDAFILLDEREQLADVDLAKLRELVGTGSESGLSPDDGDAVLDGLEAKYRALADR